MCLIVLLIALAFYIVPIGGARYMAAERQRSRYWVAAATVPVLGFITTAILGFLPPFGKCVRCGRGAGSRVLMCPECGGPIQAAPSLRPLTGQQINPGIGLSIIGSGVLMLCTLAYFLAVRPMWAAWDAWEFQGVQARLMDDPHIVQALGAPLHYGYPQGSAWEGRNTAWGTCRFTVTGPKGQAKVNANYVTCEEHGWHFRTLSVTPTHGAAIRVLSDQHVGPYKPALGSVCLPSPDSSPAQHWSAVILARLARDPGLLKALKEPMLFPSRPVLRPEGEGRWSFAVDVRGQNGKGVVEGLLATNPQAFTFPRIDLRLKGQEEPISLHRGPDQPPFRFPRVPFVYRLWAFAWPSIQEGLLPVGIVLAAFAAMGLAIWMKVRRRSNREGPPDPFDTAI